jgi:NAD(P)-dependent dehydrogenase (short-subunit alcohol dehydrogenase family)
MKSIYDLMSLKGRRALITGASGGLGKQITITIAELGGDLVLVDQPGIKYDELIDTIRSIGNVKVTCLSCDLEDGQERALLISKLLDQKAPLNILINNAAFVGTSNLEGWITDFHNQTLETWRRALEVNITSIFDLSKGLSPKIKHSGNGTIINIASIYGVYGPDYSLYEGTLMGNPAAYAATKGGLIQLTRWLATTLAPEIRVNSISPGGIFRNQPEKFIRRYEKRTPMGRMATEEDFKGVIAYLTSDLSSYVTGQNLHVDGGWGIW